MKRTAISRVSRKRREAGGLLPNSTFARKAGAVSGRVPNPPASPSSSPLKRGGGTKKVSGGRGKPALHRKPLPRGTAPLKKVNPARQAKRRKSYVQKLAAYRRSETYKLVDQRAGGFCEFDQMPITCRADNLRCGANRWAGDRLTHHHKTYARFGGKELPEDVIVLCDRHNAEAEAQHPTRRRGR